MRLAAILLLPLLSCASYQYDAADKDMEYLQAFPSQDYTLVEVPDVGKFYVDDNPSLVKKALRAGRPWEPEVQDILKKHLVPGSIALDIGAHIGSLTIPMANMIGPDGHVYAFEPQKKIYRELFHNIKVNDLRNVTPFRYAVGSEAGFVEMESGVESDGRVGVGEGGERVEVRTIDSFRFTDVNLIKIDVEGFEVEVLRGAEKTIRACRPILVVEIAKIEAKSILRKYGYDLRLIRGRRTYLAFPREGQ